MILSAFWLFIARMESTTFLRHVYKYGYKIICLTHWKHTKLNLWFYIQIYIHEKTLGFGQSGGFLCREILEVDEKSQVNNSLSSEECSSFRAPPQKTSTVWLGKWGFGGPQNNAFSDSRIVGYPTRTAMHILRWDAGRRIHFFFIFRN